MTHACNENLMIEDGVNAPDVISCSQLSKVFISLDEIGVIKLLREDRLNYEGYKALNDVSLSVPDGQFVGLLGLNGSGKSTLLRTIAGIYSPTSGVISINGAISGLYELGVSGNEELTGREFAKRWLSIQGVTLSQAKNVMDDIHCFSELGSYFDKEIFTYSSGMKVRLYFAVATALPGNVFLIDEALSVGDKHFQAKCWRRLRERLGKGSSGLLATHDWSAILKLCKTAFVLDKGKVVDFGESKGVVTRYLNLKSVETAGGKFLLTSNDSFNLDSHSEIELSIPIRITTETGVSFGFSIEQFREGEGWEHIIQRDVSRLNVQCPGAYSINIQIPSLDLVAGEYSLNLFLSDSEGRCLDVRSWTYDNDLLLMVHGSKRKGAVSMPVNWCELDV